MIKFFNIIIHKIVCTSSYLKKIIIDLFHVIYYRTPESTLHNTRWFGKILNKCPLDLWVYQEIIYKLKPDVIIESGTSYGGSALYLASICDLVKNGKIITIDVLDKPNRPNHDRIIYLLGSSTSSEIIKQVEGLMNKNDEVLVILDSLHEKYHVLKELKLYSKFVTLGSYIIVEDSNINNHPVLPNFGPGPSEAIVEFLEENKKFIIDKKKEKYFMTLNPNGYLKKIKN